MLEEQRLAAEDDAKAKEEAEKAAAAAKAATPPPDSGTMQVQAAAADVSEIVELLEGELGSSSRPIGRAVNANDAMELCSTAELTDLFAEYYQADLDNPNFLVSDSKCNGDIPFDHATLIDSGVAATIPVNTRAVLGNSTEAYSYADMIDTD